MRPGIAARPARSITRVDGSTSRSISALVPTARMRPSRMASACAISNRLLTVMILPLRRISGVLVMDGHPVRRLNRAQLALHQIRYGLFISCLGSTCMVPAWLHNLSWGFLALGALCALVIAADELKRPQHMWIMNI